MYVSTFYHGKLVTLNYPSLTCTLSLKFPHTNILVNALPINVSTLCILSTIICLPNFRLSSHFFLTFGSVTAIRASAVESSSGNRIILPKLGIRMMSANELVLYLRLLINGHSVDNKSEMQRFRTCWNIKCDVLIGTQNNT